MGLFSNIPFLKRSQPAAEPALPELAAAPAGVVAAPAASPPAEAAVALPAAAPIASQARAQAEALVQSVVRELPDFVTVAVVEAASGQILAGQWAGHSGGAVEVAAANAEIVRQTQQALLALQLEPTGQLEDIMITLRRQLYLLRVLPQQQWLLYLAMRTQDTNQALARAVLQNLAY